MIAWPWERIVEFAHEEKSRGKQSLHRSRLGQTSRIEPIKIIWTEHARERQREWHKKLGITVEDVEEVIRNPTQIVAGDRDALVAQTKRGEGLLRVPFVELAENRKILTLYWTSRVEKYWKE